MQRSPTFSRIAALALATLVTGCAGTIRLYEDGMVHLGSYNQASRQVEVDIDGERYVGSYAQGASGSFGGGFVGTQAVSFSGISFDGSGQALLVSPSGRVLKCRFGSVVGWRGHGQCQMRDGRLFEMVIGS